MRIPINHVGIKELLSVEAKDQTRHLLALSDFNNLYKMIVGQAWQLLV